MCLILPEMVKRKPKNQTSETISKIASYKATFYPFSTGRKNCDGLFSIAESRWLPLRVRGVQNLIFKFLTAIWFFAADFIRLYLTVWKHLHTKNRKGNYQSIWRHSIYYGTLFHIFVIKLNWLLPECKHKKLLIWLIK